MAEAVLAALITGGLSLAGVILSNLLAARKTEAAMRINQAVTDTKLEDVRLMKAPRQGRPMDGIYGRDGAKKEENI